MATPLFSVNERTRTCHTSTTVCPICLDSLTDRDTNQLPCGHTFHSKCIMTNNSACPMCRNDFAHPIMSEDARSIMSEEEDNDDESERLIQHVADRIESRFETSEIKTMLEKFDIPDDTRKWKKRRVCELFAEQLTMETDDDDEEDA